MGDRLGIPGVVGILHVLHMLDRRARGATVARLTPDQKVACSNHVGVICFSCPVFVVFGLTFSKLHKIYTGKDNGCLVSTPLSMHTRILS